MAALKDGPELPEYSEEFTHVLHLSDGRLVGSSGAIPTNYSDDTGVYSVVHVIPWSLFPEDYGKAE